MKRHFTVMAKNIAEFKLLFIVEDTLNEIEYGKIFDLAWVANHDYRACILQCMYVLPT